MRVRRAVCVAVLLAGAAIRADSPPEGSPLTRAVDAEISSQEALFLAAVEAMPPGKFDFSPDSLALPGTELRGVRSFAAQVRHVAADNFAIWAPVGGKPELESWKAPNGPPEMTSRDEILRFLRDSFAFAHQAARGLTSDNLLQDVEFRKRRVTRLSLVVLATTHVSDHYGQLALYLRMCGVVPPASRPRTPAPPGASKS